ncbi:MAG: hypothetical protein QNI84_17030 [Henriciella sp.]|nr:hypothetical protein [Henriciella sp.]
MGTTPIEFEVQELKAQISSEDLLLFTLRENGDLTQMTAAMYRFCVDDFLEAVITGISTACGGYPSIKCCSDLERDLGIPGILKAYLRNFIAGFYDRRGVEVPGPELDAYARRAAVALATENGWQPVRERRLAWG